MEEEDKKQIALGFILGATKDVLPEKEAEKRFEEEWPKMKDLSLQDIAVACGGLTRAILMDKFAAAEKPKVVAQPPQRSSATGPASAPVSAPTTAPAPSSASSSVEAEELMILDYGFRASGVPADVLTPLKRKLATLLHKFDEEKRAVMRGEAQFMPVEHVLVEVLLYDYGDQLVANGWGPIISGSEAWVIRDMWEQLALFGNFNAKYDNDQDKLVQVNIDGVERDIPAWQVIVYAALGQLLKYLNIPDTYGWEYFDEVLRQMGQ